MWGVLEPFHDMFWLPQSLLPDAACRLYIGVPNIFGHHPPPPPEKTGQHLKLALMHIEYCKQSVSPTV